MKESVNFD